MPYAYKDDQWVGYDDPQSIAKKVSVIKELRLGGAMVSLRALQEINFHFLLFQIWSLEHDDFRGNCGGEKYPLLRTLNKELYS